jgi:O-antigen/teichoic acid export membrane protein
VMLARRETIGSTLLFAYASTGLTLVANQAYVFLIFRCLPIESVGLYSWAIAVATIYVYAMDFGLPAFLMGELSERRYRLRAVIQVILITRTPVLVLGVAGLIAWISLYHPTRAESLAMGLVTTSYTIQLVDGGLAPWLQLRLQQNALNAIGVVLPLARLLGIIVPLGLRREFDLTYVGLVMVATQVASTASFVIYAARDARHTLPAPATNGALLMLRHFRQRGPRLGVMYILMGLQARLDWLMVSALVSRVALANYSLANRVIEFGMLLAGVLARTSFPWHSRADADNAPLGARLAIMQRLFAWFSALLGVGLFFWVPPLIQLFFGGRYAGAASATRLMTLATPVFMLNQYLFYILLVRRREHSYTYLILAATVLQVGVNLALLPRLGIAGAAVGMLVMGVSLHGGQLVLLVRDKALQLAEAFRLEAFVFGSAAVVAALWLADVGPAIGTFAGLAAVGALGMALMMERGDRPMLREYAIFAAERSMARLLRSGAK